MPTKSGATRKAIRLSRNDFIDEVVVVFKKKNGEYDCCLELEFTGNRADVYEKYLNGKIVI